MSFFAELKRRNVVRVGLAYVVIGWVLAQVAEFAFENFGTPDWALKTFVVVLLLGLPLALFFAWALEITPDGVKLEKNVDRSQSITKQTGRKLDFIITGVLVVAVGFLLVDRFGGSEDTAPTEESVIASNQSIAVLPFVNMSDDKDYFADGLSEELLNLLAKIPDLKVAGRTSSFAFKGRNDDFEAIGEALKVEHVLEGSVRRSGDRVRITAQLIKVDDGYHLWSETYDRDMEDIFDIQDDVAAAITSELKLHLAPESARPTDNIEAYALYLEVLATSEYPRGDISSGIALLNRAIELDPEFAKAYERKAMLYWLASGWSIESSAGQELVYESAAQALAIDPTLVAARSFSVSADPNNTSWVREIAAIEEAVAAAPNDMRALDSLAWDYMQTGYFEEALALALRMIEIDPLSARGHGRAVNAFSAMGRKAEAEQYLNSVKTLDPDAGGWYKTIAKAIDGDDEEAIAGYEHLFRRYGLDPSEVRPLFEGARDPINGKTFIVDFIENSKANAPDFAAVGAAQLWYLAFGYLDEYWREIEETAAKTGTGWSGAGVLEHACRVFAASGCAAHPRAIEYAKQTGLTDLWDQRGAPDNCTKPDGEWTCQ